MPQFKLPACLEPTLISRERTIRGLLAMGWFEYEKGRELQPTGWKNPRSMKYRIFSSPNGCGFQYLIGKSGALRRVNNGGTIGDSLSLTGGRIHAAICEVGSGNFRFESSEQACEVYRKILA